MTLERALEVAINDCEVVGRVWDREEKHAEAAAVLRAFMETGLPFYRAAEAWAIHCGPLDDSDMTLSSKEFVNVIAAYREMK